MKILKNDEEFKTIKKSICEIFLDMSQQLETTHECMSKMDSKYQQKLARNLMIFAIDMIKEACVLDQDGDINQATMRYVQAQFLLDELLIEIFKAQKYENNNIKVTQSNNDSANGRISDVQRSSKSYKSKNSVSYMSQNEYILDLQDINEDEIDKIYSTITTRLERMQG